MKELLNRIIQILKINDNEILFDDINKKSIKIKKENHKKIISINTNKSIAFVDGGNLEIIKTPALSLFFNRIYYCIYKKNKRVDKKRIEFYSLITSDEKNISSTCYPKIIKDYSFDPFDKDLITSHRRLSVSKVGNFIRRLAELKTSLEINSDFVVLDGSLDYVHKYEKEIINDFNNIAGLSKTISLITKNGLSVAGYLNKINNKETWYYKAKDNLYFIKLHKNSKYVFRLDYPKNDLDVLLSLLIENSKDPIFLGYPYGLIEADKFARVSKKEAEILKLNIKTKLKKDYKEIEPHLNSMNSHYILDNIS